MAWRPAPAALEHRGGSSRSVGSLYLSLGWFGVSQGYCGKLILDVKVARNVIIVPSAKMNELLVFVMQGDIRYVAKDQRTVLHIFYYF